ncbi:MAG: glycosyltransferase family 2 protein [Leptothrix sp. (in: b-proteobacteria)]
MTDSASHSNLTADRARWQVPACQVSMWRGRRHRHCVVIPVINEGARIRSLLDRMKVIDVAARADIVIVDGGSTDGSLAIESLQARDVCGLLVKTGPGRLSAQLLCAYAHVLDQGYEGIVTIDGNDKDDPDSIGAFIDCLEDGYDFVQASRYLTGGVAINTPKSRDFAIRWIHAPLLSLSSGFRWTDTTQGFRGYSARMLRDVRMAPFRRIFREYELLAYLSHQAPRLGYRCIELPTARRYPEGEVPTKISAVRGNLRVLTTLLKACSGAYGPGS